MAWADLRDLLGRCTAQSLAEAGGRDSEVAGAAVQAAIEGGAQPAEGSDLALALGRLQAALDAAQGTILGLLGGRYPELEADPEPPGFLRRANLDLAAYALLGGDEDEARRRIYDDTMRTLRGMAEGRIDLYPASAPEAEGGALVLDAPPEAFGRSRLAGFVDGLRASA